ncbi:MAG: DUF485 domain-containing protein [Pseudomonadota bacterium]
MIKNSNIHWEAIEADLRFQALQKDKNRFLWRMMLFALIYFFCLPIAAAYFQSILTIKIWGIMNVGLLFALSQFIVAWCIAAIYAKRANREFDARAKTLVDDAHNIKGVA